MNLFRLKNSNSTNHKFNQRALVLIPLVLACFGLSQPIAQAVSPAPDGGYPGANTAEGDFALLSLTSGVYNTAIGGDALRANTTGTENTAIGTVALRFNTMGGQNTATGVYALYQNTTASDNTATGFEALFFNTTGANNTATGALALFNNTIGIVNTASGTGALFNNTIGSGNTATGVQALTSNSTGNRNTAEGDFALFSTTTANDNTATGFKALFSNTTGVFNTAIGSLALYNNTSGGGNIAVGDGAGFSITTGANNIDIDNEGEAADNQTIRIGNIQTATFIAGISGVTAGTDAVFVDSNGQLGVGVPSSGRFKTEIKPMDKASEAILALKPVTFRYKKEIDPKGMLRFGLVAEQVEKVNPELVGRDAKGQVSSVRYDAVNAMLLNEFLKEHRAFLKEQRKVQQQEATIAELKKEMGTVVARLKEQASQIQKVSAQLEVSKPAPQTVLNNQ